MDADTRPSPEHYVLGTSVRLTGWSSTSYCTTWDDMILNAEMWRALQTNGIDLHMPRPAEPREHAHFREMLRKQLCSRLCIGIVPHQWHWCLATDSNLVQSSLWTMREISNELLAAKDAVVKRRLAVLDKLKPVFAITPEEDLKKYLITYGSLSQNLPYRLGFNMCSNDRIQWPARAQEDLQAYRSAITREWQDVARQEREINARLTAEGLPFVRVHAQLTELHGAPPVKYDEEDLATIRALAEKYAGRVQHEQPNFHAYAMLYQAVGGIHATSAPMKLDAEQVTAYTLSPRPRAPKEFVLRLYVHRKHARLAASSHTMMSLLRPAEISDRYPALAALMRQCNKAFASTEEDRLSKHHARLLETLRAPRALRLRDICDNDNNQPARALKDAVVRPGHGNLLPAAAPAGCLPHQGAVLRRMLDMELDILPQVAVPPANHGMDHSAYDCVKGVPRVPGLPLTVTRRRSGQDDKGSSSSSSAAAAKEDKSRKSLEYLRKCRRRGGVLLQTAGLGKMIETLLLIRAQKQRGGAHRGPTLVLCPGPVVPTWVNEAKSRGILAHAAQFRGEEMQTPPAADVLVCAYETLTQEARIRRILGGEDGEEATPRWHRVVLDESQKIIGSSSSSKRAQAILARLQLPALSHTIVWCLTIPDYSLSTLLKYVRQLFWHHSPRALLDLKNAHEMYSMRRDCTGTNARNTAPLQRLLGAVFLLQTEAHLREAGMASVPLHRHAVELRTPGYLKTLSTYHGEVLRRRLLQERRPWMLVLPELERTVLGLEQPPAALAMPAGGTEEASNVLVLTSAQAAVALANSASSFVQGAAQKLARKRKGKGKGKGKGKRRRLEHHTSNTDEEDEEEEEEDEDEEEGAGKGAPPPAPPQEEEEEEACPICMQEYDDEDDVTLTVIRTCGHTFHRACLQRWRDQGRGGGACPVCRVPVTDRNLVHFSSSAEREEDAGGASSEPTLPHAVLEARRKAPPLVETPKIVHLRDTLLPAIPEDEKVVVMCRNKELHAAVETALRAAFVPLCVIKAGQSAEDRENNRRFFQESTPEEARVMVMTTQTAGVGITLTRANHLVLLEPALSQSIQQQAVGRVHRQSQTRPVHVHTLAMRGTLDTRVMEVDAAAATSKDAARAQGIVRLPRSKRKVFLLTGQD